MKETTEGFRFDEIDALIEKIDQCHTIFESHDDWKAKTDALQIVQSSFESIEVNKIRVKPSMTKVMLSFILLAPFIVVLIGETRPSVVEETCAMISAVAVICGEEFKTFADKIMLTLLNLMSVKISRISRAGKHCLSTLSKHSKYSLQQMKHYYDQSAHAEVRQLVLEQFVLVMFNWPKADIESTIVLDAIKSGLTDSNKDVRAAACEALITYAEFWIEDIEVLATIPSKSVQDIIADTSPDTSLAQVIQARNNIEAKKNYTRQVLSSSVALPNELTSLRDVSTKHTDTIQQKIEREVTRHSTVLAVSNHVKNSLSTYVRTKTPLKSYRNIDIKAETTELVHGDIGITVENYSTVPSNGNINIKISSNNTRIALDEQNKLVSSDAHVNHCSQTFNKLPNRNVQLWYIMSFMFGLLCGAIIMYCGVNVQFRAIRNALHFNGMELTIKLRGGLCDSNGVFQVDRIVENLYQLSCGGYSSADQLPASEF